MPARVAPINVWDLSFLDDFPSVSFPCVAFLYMWHKPNAVFHIRHYCLLLSSFHTVLLFTISLKTLINFTMLTISPHTIDLPKFGKAVPLPEQSSSNPNTVASQWISKLESVLASKDASRLASIFHPDCWWRDTLAFQWDFRTVHGLEKLTEFVGKYQETAQISNLRLHENGQFAPSLAKPMEGLEWIESMFDFETKTGRGSGMLRIVQGTDGVWKGYMMYTVLKELKGAEEIAGYRRPHGGNNSLLGGAIKGNWQERRQRQHEFLDEEPQILLVGAGMQSPSPNVKRVT